MLMATPNQRKRRRILCLCVTVAIIVVLGLLFLILGLTVFKPKDPDIAVDSTTFSDLDFSLDIPNLRVRFNVTIDTRVTVKNPNRVGFQHDNSTAFLRYRGNDVGQASIPAGKVGARDSTTMSLTLHLMADRLVSDSNFYSDVVSGTVPFQTFVRLSGKVRILFYFHVLVSSTCDLEIHLLQQSLNQTCHYKTKV